MRERTDKTTAAVIDAAIHLSATAGVRHAAHFLFTRCVPVWVAHRVLIRPSRRRADGYSPARQLTANKLS